MERGSLLPRPSLTLCWPGVGDYDAQELALRKPEKGQAGRGPAHPFRAPQSSWLSRDPPVRV